jgi:hypothetical protein
MPENKQIIVTDQKLTTLVGTFMRQITLIITGVTMLISLFGKHDILGMINYVQSSDLLNTVSVTFGIGVLIYGLVREYLNKLKVLRLADLVPNSIAVVVDPLWKRIFH